jgi:hypothetical protein
MQKAVACCLAVFLLLLGLAVIIGCGNTQQAEQEEPPSQKQNVVQEQEEPQLQQQDVVPEQDEPVEKVFVGSVKSNKFHRPNCRWADRIKPANRIWFSSAKHARSKGYEPCKTCKPEGKS